MLLFLVPFWRLVFDTFWCLVLDLVISTYFLSNIYFSCTKEKQCKIAMVLLCPAQGPWASSLVHLSRRLKCTIVITHCPSSVCPSLPLHIFDFSSKTARRNSTKLDRKQDLNVLYKVCVFRANQKNKMVALASDRLRHFWLLLWNCWTEFNETWQGSRSQCPLPSLCFSGLSEKQDGRPGLWLAETFSTSPLKVLNRIQQNLSGSKISTSSTKFVFFGPIGKTRWPPWSLICWDIFDFSSETAERNSTKLTRKQDLNVLYQVCVFGADRKNKMAALTSDWLRYFWLLLWNCWTIFNETWQEARSLRPLPSFVLRADRKNKMADLASDSLTHFRLLFYYRWTEFNETCQEARSQRPLPSLCFSGRSEKTRWPPWPLIGWDILHFSSETAERNSIILDRKQDLNVLYQVCVFWADQKTKMAALADSSKRWHIVLRCTICGPLGLLSSRPVVFQSCRLGTEAKKCQLSKVFKL